MEKVLEQMEISPVSKLVSVVMPIYNREKLVCKAIDSVLKQSYEKFELVLVNDGSTDNSGEVLDFYASKYPDRVCVLHQKNAGQVVARNNGIKISKGELIAFLDSDDIWLPDKLSKQINLFHGNVGLVYSGIHEIDIEGNIIRTVLPRTDMRGNVFNKLLVKNAMTGGSVVVARKALYEVGLFDTTLPAAENWDLWIRIAKKYAFDFIAEPLMCYLKHDDNMSSNFTLMKKATEKILKKHLSSDNGNLISWNVKTHAYAHFHYGAGVNAFGKKQYKLSRKEFIACWRCRFFYRDSGIRFLRTFLGSRGNTFLTRLRRKHLLAHLL